jgi:hypothetical protein
VHKVILHPTILAIDPEDIAALHKHYEPFVENWLGVIKDPKTLVTFGALAGGTDAVDKPHARGAPRAIRNHLCCSKAVNFDKHKDLRQPSSASYAAVC